MRFEREISGAIAIPVVLAVLWFAPAWAFGLLAAGIGLATLREFLRIAEISGIPVPKRLAMLLAAATMAAAVFPPAGLSAPWVVGLAFALSAIFAAAALAAAV